MENDGKPFPDTYFTVSQFEEMTGLDARTIKKRLKIIHAEPDKGDGRTRWCSIKALSCLCSSVNQLTGYQSRTTEFFIELKESVYRSWIRKIIELKNKRGSAKEVERLRAGLESEIWNLEQLMKDCKE